MRLPALDERARWSIRVVDAVGGEELLAFGADTVCETASIGKVFLLLEVARSVEAGRLRLSDRIELADEHFVEDSGLLYRMRDRRITVDDAALLVGAVSDNLATNALIGMCGLDAVRAVSHELGCRETELHDFIRDERTPELPWTPSFGTARELADVMRRLGCDELLSPEVCAHVRRWLAAGVDTSMLADAFLLDPLAHAEPEYQGIELHHKTGSTSFARVDVGHVRGPAGAVAYAVAANWKGVDADLRAPVIDAMRAVGEQIRARITGRERADA